VAKNLRSLAELSKIVVLRADQLEKATIRGLQSAGYRLEGMIPEAIAETAPHPPDDTGDLVRSHYTDLTARGALVGVDAPHAPFMEWGTRPHRPPMQPIADWAYRKGLVPIDIDVDELFAIERSEWIEEERTAFAIVSAIVKKIEKEGIEPRHFMRRAVDRLLREGIIDEEIEAEIAKIG